MRRYMYFLHSVAGRSLRDRVRSVDPWREVGGASKGASLVGSAIWLGCLLGTSSLGCSGPNWKETLGYTRYISSGYGTTWDLPGGTGKLLLMRGRSRHIHHESGVHLIIHLLERKWKSVIPKMSNSRNQIQSIVHCCHKELVCLVAIISDVKGLDPGTRCPQRLSDHLHELTWLSSCDQSTYDMSRS